MNFRDRLRNKIEKLKGEPKKLAKSFAVGSFIGVSPMIGMQVLISLLLSWIFKMNKTAAVAGVLNTNWTKGLYLYPVNYKIGASILGGSDLINIKSIFQGNVIQNLINSGPSVFFSLLIGGFITGSIIAIAYYFIVLKVITSNSKKLA